MTSVYPFQEKRIVNMAIVALPIQVMILVSFGTIIILCCSQALSTLISDYSEQKSQLCVRWFFCYSLMFFLVVVKGTTDKLVPASMIQKQIRLRTLP